ncbi:MAG: hypothetical protein NTY38_33980, partial [Acidobacteria bacterium]|nr:hypothetical protein [Acidobacteriota bacterium]
MKSTCLGGTAADEGHGIAVAGDAPNQRILLAGMSYSADLSTATAKLQAVLPTNAEFASLPRFSGGGNIPPPVDPKDVEVALVPPPVISITMTADKSEVANREEPVLFTITVSHTGPSATVTLTDNITNILVRPGVT